MCPTLYVMCSIYCRSLSQPPEQQQEKPPTEEAQVNRRLLHQPPTHIHYDMYVMSCVKHNVGTWIITFPTTEDSGADETEVNRRLLYQPTTHTYDMYVSSPVCDLFNI